MRVRHLLALAAALVAGAGPTTTSASGAVQLQSVGRFTAPVHVTGAPGDSERLYVVEQGGRVMVVRDGAASLFADLSADVLFSGEQGLLSIAFAPDFPASRLLYAYFTDRAGDNRVEELRAPTDDAVDPASRRLVLMIPHPGAPNHNGGQLQFGPDGMLYLAPGDGARASNARDLSSLLGKVLRIDPRGTAPGVYAIPADNPFAGQPGARAEIWASGLRNPYRFSFDRVTGDLVIGDVGESTTEEIDFLPAAGGRGKRADLGWNVCEGSFALGSRTTPCTTGVLPVIDRFRDGGYRSIIPGYVVRDPSLPSLQGRLVYGDYFAAGLRSAVLGLPGATDDRAVGVSVAQLTSFGEDAGGCVYATSAAGAVYRLVETDTRIPCPAAPVPSAPPTVPTTPDSSPPPPATTTAPPTTTRAGARRAAPRLRTGVVARRQRVLRAGRVVVRARCAVRCRVRARARLRIGRRSLALRPAATVAPPGVRVRLAPALTRPATRALRAALRRGAPARIVVTLRARALDSGVRSRAVRHTVRVRR